VHSSQSGSRLWLPARGVCEEAQAHPAGRARVKERAAPRTLRLTSLTPFPSHLPPPLPPPPSRSTEYDADYTVRNPTVTTFDTSPNMAEHECNTDRVLHKNAGMRHFEGGWPENVDGTEAEQVDRYLKKANKDHVFKKTVQGLGAKIEGAVRQNNTVDIYEEYFSGEGSSNLELSSEPPSAKGVAVFRDPAPVKRTATAVNWHPEGNRIAVAYSLLRFQDERMMSARLPAQSYVWDLVNPNNPIIELAPPSPLVAIRFNVKTPDILVGGSYNGLVHVFDIKKPRGVAISSSSIDRSHHGEKKGMGGRRRGEAEGKQS
jgi:dynein intermediate chain 2, axonemal